LTCSEILIDQIPHTILWEFLNLESKFWQETNDDDRFNNVIDPLNPMVVRLTFSDTFTLDLKKKWKEDWVKLLIIVKNLVLI